MNKVEKSHQRQRAKKGQHPTPASGHPTASAPNIQQALDLALQHFGAGRLPEAKSIYQHILQSDPSQPDALHLLGVIAHQVGKNDLAVDLITKALAVKPDYIEAQSNLGNALHDLERLDEAIVSFQKALAIQPDNAMAHNNLGHLFRELGRPDEAVASCHAALAIKPDFALAHNNLGLALHDLGKIEEAIASYRKAQAIQPDNAMTYNNLGHALHFLERFDEAIACYHKALAIEPDHAMAHNNLGLVLRYLGKMDDAIASYHNALSLKPDYAEAHRNLAFAKKFSEYDNDIKAMEDTYAKPDLSDEQRTHLAFGLGKAFEDLQQDEKAFGFFQTGNALKRRTYDYSIESEEKKFEALKKLFEKEFFAKRQSTGSSDGTPIFILGMPRSGTTLVEQILASNPTVHGAGELLDLSQNISNYFGEVDDVKFSDSVHQAGTEHFANAGSEYISMIRKRSNTARFITDKMTGNFQLIGMIQLILPNAKVIHCHRDSRDTCLSIFKHLFNTEGLHYAQDLNELGRYYNFYRDLMNHWHNVLPGFIYDIRYEDVVADQEKQSRALLEFCGLDWDDACLEFHRTDRPILTESATQVRRPIYKDSVQAWKRYKNQLAPLLKVL